MAKKPAHPNSVKNLKPFEKGKSGNPDGRPKGARSLKTVIAEVLEQFVTEKDFAEDDEASKDALIAFEQVWGKPPTRREYMVFRQTHKAMKGDTYAFSVLADREEGKPKQTVDANILTYESFLV